jgi:hypothetical protein
LRISQERFEDEIKELYYREPVSKEEIKKLAEERVLRECFNSKEGEEHCYLKQ